MGGTNQEIEINAPVDMVWQAIRDFHNMGWAPNVITNLETVGDKTFTYSIDDGPSPVSKDDVNNYIGRVAVEGAGEGTRVEWTSNWENNDEAAQDFCSGIYNALLNDMKASLE